jgi:hypothetical protein
MFEFYVHIIESPSDDDLFYGRQEGRLLMEGLGLAGIPCRYRLAINENVFKRAFGELRELSNNRADNFIIHISAHGNETGIVLSDGSPMIWDKLKGLLSPISSTSKRLPVICLSSCMGFSGISMVDMGGPLPFSGLVGSHDQITYPDAAIGFIAFYNRLSKDGKIVAAIEAAQKATGNDKFFAMKAQDVREILLTRYQQLFQETIRESDRQPK